MNWQRKEVFLTGAGGFIGSQLVEELVRLGATVKAFVRYNSRNDWGLLELLPNDKLNQIEVIMGDLKDADAVRCVTKDVDIIFHLGSLIAIPYSYIHPRETIETNILGTLNVLTAAKEHEVEKLVHTSTSEVYGTARYVPIDENHPLQGQSPYSASKIGADKISESFYRSFDLPVATIRPFNTFGPRQSARAVIPTIIMQALTKEKIFLGSLHPTRDYTYVKDVVEGFIKVAESPESVGEVINIGSNFEISIGDLVNKIFSLIGKNAEIITDSARIRPQDSEVERLWCDNTKAKRLLGWEPKTSLDNGLEKTIEWISEHMNLYKPELYNR
uniref:GDP-mannose 4,6-dehydratase n=1 Tax=Candidatus Methanogaster sp. ANME-2c ERB4 TaxID=2759911 RepID=A0A7G9Y188_9EURY|nr:GDP-mannose 4,6-dehydratase [Methanosarcinales archaeon ANME-2c ERB4]QNO42749.1 GDP-mannose 4,6-dehydratase [Methanosarcinales archaeon ANME-2c ERB4]